MAAPLPSEPVAVMEWASFGVRDGILLVVALAAIYLVIMLFKLIGVGRHAQQQRSGAARESPSAQRDETVALLQGRAMAEPPLGASANEDVVAEATPAEPFAVPPAPTFEWNDVRDLFGEAPAPLAAPAMPPRIESPAEPVPPAVPRKGGFGEHLADHLARTDMEMEMQRMRDEMERMRAEMEELRAARRVSPQYAEAMELVQRGLSAQDVADRLGISLAEAELVHALGQSRQNFDEGDDHGADANANGAAGFDAFGQRRAR